MRWPMAASGQSNVYPDIIGGTGANVNAPAQQNYIVRNAYMAALCPSQSVGVNVLKMNNQSMKDAAFPRHQLAQHLYTLYLRRGAQEL